MSISKICYQGLICTFDAKQARLSNKEGKVVAKFMRDGGFFTCQMKIKRPSGFAGLPR